MYALLEPSRGISHAISTYTRLRFLAQAVPGLLLLYFKATLAQFKCAKFCWPTFSVGQDEEKNNPIY